MDSKNVLLGTKLIKKQYPEIQITKQLPWALTIERAKNKARTAAAGAAMVVVEEERERAFRERERGEWKKKEKAGILRGGEKDEFRRSISLILMWERSDGREIMCSEFGRIQTQFCW